MGQSFSVQSFFFKLIYILYNFRNILVNYENELESIKLPSALEWDMWGAIFYVGTIFTTIGYGNITPRTTTGQALSILYAMFGIPLVLAILNQFSKKLTKFLSQKWIMFVYFLIL